MLISGCFGLSLCVFRCLWLVLCLFILVIWLLVGLCLFCGWVIVSLVGGCLRFSGGFGLMFPVASGFVSWFAVFGLHGLISSCCEGLGLSVRIWIFWDWWCLLWAWLLVRFLIG